MQHIPSYTNPEGNPYFGTPNHPDWSLFIQNDGNIKNYPRVATYINKCLSRMRFSLRKDLINHQDINIINFHNGQDVNFIINIYLDSNQTALQVLHNNTRNIRNTLVMTGDFNIRDSGWDPNVHYHSIHIEDLMFIANSLNLNLAIPMNLGPTRFANNQCDSNSVLDLVFMNPNNTGFNKHTLNPDICCHKLHLAITPQILAQFPRYKTCLKALMKTFQTMPKMCQSNQYSSRYQLMSAGY